MFLLVFRDKVSCPSWPQANNPLCQPLQFQEYRHVLSCLQMDFSKKVCCYTLLCSGHVSCSFLLKGSRLQLGLVQCLRMMYMEETRFQKVILYFYLSFQLVLIWMPYMSYKILEYYRDQENPFSILSCDEMLYGSAFVICQNLFSSNYFSQPQVHPCLQKNNKKYHSFVFLVVKRKYDLVHKLLNSYFRVFQNQEKQQQSPFQRTTCVQQNKANNVE